jgi:hypothetical protein
MKKTLTAVLAAATIAVVLAGSTTDASAWRRGWGPGGFIAGLVGGAIIAGAIMASRPQGYVAYPAYAQPLNGPNCYWAAQPVYGPGGRVVGYTGQPVQVCPVY